MGSFRNTPLEISKDNIPGHRRITSSGHNPVATATEQTVWPGGGDIVFRTSATTMTVSSDNANDASGGTGGTLVLVAGLDANYDEITEFINPNGVTGTTTANSYLRVNKLTIVTSGSSNFNVGTVYIGTGGLTAGVPATIDNLIEPETSISRSAFFTVPNGHSVTIVVSSNSIDSNKIIALRFCTHLENGTRICGNEAHVQVSESFALAWPSSRVTEKIDIEFRAATDAGTGEIDVNIGMILIDNTYTGGA